MKVQLKARVLLALLISASKDTEHKATIAQFNRIGLIAKKSLFKGNEESFFELPEVKDIREKLESNWSSFVGKLVAECVELLNAIQPEFGTVQYFAWVMIETALTEFYYEIGKK